MEFTYHLTDSHIEILESTISRHKFEEWLRDWHPLDFPLGGDEEMEQYWRGMSERDPQEDILQYIRIYKKNSEWDRISKALAAITKTFSV